jgi:ABC-type glutathione transport system ATPase component
MTLLAEQEAARRPPSPDAAEIRSADAVRRRIDALLLRRKEREKRSLQLAKEFGRLNDYLGVAEKVTVALEQLSEQLFQQLLGVVQEKLTIALQEILEQPIQLKASAEFKRGAASVEFWIERGGPPEDILKGQGGSVANILSVGLRMFALTTLDESQHRRFLVLDEQDCWLRPDLIPRLVKIVHEAGKALGFQTLMISHHDVALFERYADRIYRLSTGPDGAVLVEKLFEPAPVADA